MPTSQNRHNRLGHNVKPKVSSLRERYVKEKTLCQIIGAPPHVGLGRRNLIKFLEAQQRLMVRLRDAIKV
jgi:hypothetical protein